MTAMSTIKGRVLSSTIHQGQNLSLVTLETDLPEGTVIDVTAHGEVELTPEMAQELEDAESEETCDLAEAVARLNAEQDAHMAELKAKQLKTESTQAATR